jgi:hypothetical protein
MTFRDVEALYGPGGGSDEPLGPGGPAGPVGPGGPGSPFSPRSAGSDQRRNGEGNVRAIASDDDAIAPMAAATGSRHCVTQLTAVNRLRGA